MPDYTIGNISVSPSTGNITGTLNITATATTKRSAKTIKLMAKGTGSYSDRRSSNSINVTQEGLGDLVQLSGSNINSAGGSASLSGQCNLKTITLSDKSGTANNLLSYLTSATIQIGTSSPVDITASFTAAPHSYIPAGDPGEDAPYILSLGFSSIPASESDKTWYIVVSGQEVSLAQGSDSPGPGPEPQPTTSIRFTSTDSSYISGDNIVVQMASTAGDVVANTVKVTTSSDNPSWNIVEVTP